MKLAWHRARPPAAPPRRWFAYDDGGYYRNCPNIMRERDEVLAWPNSPRKFAILKELREEWDATFSRGVQYAEMLGEGDVCVPHAKSVRDWWPQLVASHTAHFGPEEADRLLDEFDALPYTSGDPKWRWKWQPPR